MTQVRLSIALPSQSYDDFPIKLPPVDAASLLRCWTSAWHPAILSRLRSRPDIWSIDDSGGNSSGVETAASTIVVPTFAQSAFRDCANAAQAVHLACYDTPDANRDELVAELCDQLNAPLGGDPQGADSSKLASDFFALAYGWLQVRLMTLRVRYSSNLDDEVFDAELLAAASAWADRRFDETDSKLTRCFDLLLEEKNAYYSVEPDLIDLVLVEATTLGDSLGRQLSRHHHLNLLLTGEVAAQIGQRNGPAAEMLRAKVAAGEVSLVGGVQHELPAGLMPIEAQLRQFQRGAVTFESALGLRPKVFSQRRFGLTPMTPGLLEQLDYCGALHVTFDGGALPHVNASNMRWMGEDGQSVPGLATVPIDAADASQFLDLGIRIAKQLDAEHASTTLFAHWPGQGCDSFGDLQRLARRGALFGDFISANDYFESTYDPGYGDTFTAEQYESPLRQQQITQGAESVLSRHVDCWRWHQQLSACRSLAAMASVLKPADSATIVAKVKNWLDSIASAETKVDMLCCHTLSTEEQQSHAVEMQQELDQLCDMIAQGFAQCLSNSETAETTALTINPLSQATAGHPPAGTPIELPATGWHATLDDSATKRSLAGPPVDDGLTLRNEFFQLDVDPASGGIRSLQTYQQRQTQISQRLSVRLPRGRGSAGYATMNADEVTTHRISPFAAKIVSEGRLTDPQAEVDLCRFTQTVTVGRQDRVADLTVQLHDLAPLVGGENYDVCSRLAWHDESASVFYGAPELRSRSTSAWLDAPVYIRIEQPDHATTLLTGGLPWHRRSGRNRLDSLLVVGNERRREFRLGLAIDCSSDLATAMGWVTPSVKVLAKETIEPSEGWLFHFSSSHIVSLFCEALIDGGNVVGVRFRLFETQGRRGKLRLTCPFEVARAERVMFDGRGAGSLECEGQVTHIEFMRNEYFEVHLFRAF